VNSTRKRIAILGSTGSIGRQAIDVIKADPDRFELVALVAGADGEALARQASETGVAQTGLGSDAAVEVASSDDVDVVLNAVVGAAGLRASVAALGAGKRLALANKESLVAGGELCLAAAERGGGDIVPVDSEHAAIAQCLEGVNPAEVRRIILTASGGPFRKRTDLAGVTPEEALRHPTWAMGPKITIDSATLMNKGLEVIEAHFLFGLAYDDIDVTVHPQSVVHGIVELVDGSLLMQAAPPDMRIPIQAALAAPERPGPAFSALSLEKTGRLDFEPVDRERFPALGIAYAAGKKGGTYPAVLNAANEVAVAAFLDGELAFTGIPQAVEQVLSEHSPGEASDLDSVMAVDAWARATATVHVRNVDAGSVVGS
jgi:1-deoxy-D-xylulose-5-phosphate reductoisomerase